MTGKGIQRTFSYKTPWFCTPLMEQETLNYLILTLQEITGEVPE
jgi:hypothetical protein